MILFDFLQSTFRNSVADQIEEFREQQFSNKQFLPCAISGVEISKDQSHVDHFPTGFARLVFQFLKKHYPAGIVKFRPFTDSVDARNLELFREFHKSAKLRITFDKANLHAEKDCPAWIELLPPEIQSCLSNDLNGMIDLPLVARAGHGQIAKNNAEADRLYREGIFASVPERKWNRY